MANYGYMAHDDPAPPVSRSTGERMAACGVTGSWGENIAAGFPSPASVVNGWLNSPGHRANIENPSYVSMGSGAAASASGQIYWAHTFSSSGERISAAAAAVSAAVSSYARPSTGPGLPPSCSRSARPLRRSPAPSHRRRPARRARQPAPAPKAASAANPLSFRQLTLTPRRPAAGHVLGSKVIVLKRGARLKTGHVFCSARLNGRPLEVLTRRLRAGSAVCAWRLPPNAHGSMVSATVVVQQGRLRAQTPFRAKIS